MLRSVSGTGSSESSYWDGISDRLAGHYYHDAIIGRLKRDVHLRLIARWCPELRGKALLKTDLFEEAHGADEFLFDLPAGGLRAGIDISPSIARRAAARARPAGPAPPPLLAGDVLALPFRAGAFDVIVLQLHPRPLPTHGGHRRRAGGAASRAQAGGHAGGDPR